MPLDALYRTDHALWFFSTCAQTFAGLVSIFGMFILYRLQIEEGRIGGLRERMVGYDVAHAKLTFEAVLENFRQLESAHRSRQEITYADNIRQLLRDHGGALAKRAWLAHAARRPIFILAALIVWSLLWIVLYPHFAASLGFTTGILWLTWIVSALAVWDSAQIIIVSIRSD